MLSYSARFVLWSACLIALLAFALPHSAHAAALSITTLSATSSNASSTLAIPGNTVYFQLTLSGTPDSTSTPTINIFNMGSTSMSGAAANWWYSTTSASSWSTGQLSFKVAFGGSLGEATTTKTQADITGTNVTFDKTAPTLSSVLEYSNNASTTLAKAGDIITLYASSSENIATPTITVAGNAATVSMLTASTSWKATYTVQSGDTNGTTFNISFSDVGGNSGTAVTAVTGGSPVYLDTTGPVISITGSNPDSATYSASATTYSDPGASATDAHDGSVGVSNSGSLSLGTPGSFTITYTSTDTAGNTSTASRSVTVGGGASGPPIGLLSNGNIYGTPIVPGGWTSPNSPTPSSGSSPNNSSIAALQAQVQALLAQLAAMTGGAAMSSFSRNLQVGSTGADAKALQVYLNGHGYMVAKSGPGSPGSETMKFGALTKKALAAWQASVGISPAAGFFGPKTRAYIAAHP